MPVPTGILWERDLHTQAKHQMLRGYLNAWFPIIASRFGRTGLTYVDAFAGPGAYKNSSESSPVIALEQTHRLEVTKYQPLQRLLFIEKRRDRFDHLKRIVDTRFPSSYRPSGLELRVVNGDCRQELIPALQKIGTRRGPIFVNFDGWGVDTPAYLVRHIGQIDSAEVLITFQTSFFVRFAELHEIQAGDRVFGDSSWRAVASSGTPFEKKGGLVDAYRDLLTAAGFSYALTFELVDEGGHGLFLIFGTSNDRGLEKMKEAMWQVDPAYGQRFRDPRDTNQLVLDILDKPDLALLEQQLLTEVEQRGSVSLGQLQEFTLFETIYRKPHAAQAITRLEEQGRIQRKPGRGHDNVMISLAPLTLFD